MSDEGPAVSMERTIRWNTLRLAMTPPLTQIMQKEPIRYWTLIRDVEDEIIPSVYSAANRQGERYDLIPTSSLAEAFYGGREDNLRRNFNKIN